jgi:hypothetical protein
MRAVARDRQGIMALTVKRVARLLRAGKLGQHLDGPPNGVRGLYLNIEHSATPNGVCATN